MRRHTNDPVNLLVNGKFQKFESLNLNDDEIKNALFNAIVKIFISEQPDARGNFKMKRYYKLINWSFDNKYYELLGISGAGPCFLEAAKILEKTMENKHMFFYYRYSLVNISASGDPEFGKQIDEFLSRYGEKRDLS